MSPGGKGAPEKFNVNGENHVPKYEDIWGMYGHVISQRSFDKNAM